MKYSQIAKHNGSRKESKDNIYVRWSEAGNFFEK